MKLIYPRQAERGMATVAFWILLVFFLVFVIFIFGVAYTIVKTFKKLVPPPDKDPDGTVHMPALGTSYQGGTVTGYAPPPHLAQDEQAAPPPGFVVTAVQIYASDVAWPGNDPRWTNLIWTGTLDDVTNVMGSNGIPMELWPAGQLPARRFYDIRYVTGPTN